MSLRFWRTTGFTFLKFTVAAFSIWFIWFKVQSRPDFESIMLSLSSAAGDPQKSMSLVIIGLLMAVNWLLETAKWQLLLKHIVPVSWLVGFRSVLTGVTVSLFTPNRTGEFAGRVLHLPSGARIKGALASVIGSMNQLLITVLAGSVALLFSLSRFVEAGFVYHLLFGVILVLIAVVIYVYFSIPSLTRIAARFKMFRKLSLYTSIFATYSRFDLTVLSVLSAARYVVFSIQFILMLEWFDIFIQWPDALSSIALMYLVMAVVPTIALSELTVRGSVALYFFEAFTTNQAGILATSTFIWLINLVVPAVFGAVSILYFRLNK